MKLARPSAFIGSSVEGLDVAYALQENLEYDAEPTVWSQNIFTPSQSTLKALAGEAAKTDFAIFAFTPDDMRLMRGERASIPRDNVIFELGLFMGALGVERCFFVSPRSAQPLALPSDLLGLTPLTYDAERSDGRLVAALGPAANKVRGALRQLGVKAPAMKAPPPSRMDRTGYFLKTWDGPNLQAAREVLHRGIPLHRMEDEDGSATEALLLVFTFLESFADAVLAGEIDEQRARPILAATVKSVWEHAAVYFAPLNLADEWWEPPPRLAELSARWSKSA
ncbi:nucleotide-binding protein [Caulobacter sp.]|uniref:nucleotide-binding protein n=1 Tax=Caulobacter sp. TaxID=78 RepID=UPI002B4A85EF|nr:nucleotide-binding protein [Caulobacter sp.]HJV42135.1 nucleotide-binding protein [Caulobacter sp.]